MAGETELDAGPDIAHARAVLGAMQSRIDAGPHAALGVPAHATASDVRQAFFALAKTYHPVRFGRMPTELQKLATEVFLALRSAHDTLAKQAKRTTASKMEAVKPPTAQMPAVARGPAPARQPSEPQIATSRTKTGQMPTVAPKPPAPIVKPSSPPPTGGPRRTPTASPAPRHPTPPTGVKALKTVGSGAMPAMDQHLASVYELMQRGQWDQARAAIAAIGGREPDPKLRALLCYTRGREAQLERRLDEARVELDSALQLDPDLQLAKTALAELFTRRK